MYLIVTPLKTVRLLTVLLGGVACASAGYAQSTEGGGVVMRFGVTLGVSAETNRALTIGGGDSSTDAFANLSFGILSQTRTQRLSFDLSGQLLAVNTSSTAFIDEGLVSPSAALRYSLTAKASQLNLSARLNETDLSRSNVLIDDDNDGNFDIVSGDATRRQAVLEARYDWNLISRARFGVFARYTDVSFTNGSATGLDGTSLNDTQRLTFGASAALDLTTAITLNSSLTYSSFEQDDVEGSSETVSLNNSLSIARPLGNINIGFGATNTEAGTRYNTSIGRSYATLRATYTGQIGATRDVSGDLALTGAVGVVYPLPRGALNFGLSRDVSSTNDQDAERLNTQVNFGYQQALTPLSGFAVNALWAETQDTSDDGISLSNATVSATYNRTLTKDWNMNTGLRHRFTRDSELGTARSNEVFFNLSREFVTRF